jgi:DNA-binding NarL/FixJ family response regulator
MIDAGRDWLKSSETSDRTGEPRILVTGRQRLILYHLAHGLSDSAAASAASVSRRTLQREVGHLMRQLGASSRLQLGVEVAERGWGSGDCQSWRAGTSDDNVSVFNSDEVSSWKTNGGC